MIGDGTPPASATAAMVGAAVGRAGNRPEPDGTREPIATAWAAVGQRWEALLRADARLPGGNSRGVFTGTGSRRRCGRCCCTHRSTSTALDWVVARLPAARPHAGTASGRPDRARPGRRAQPRLRRRPLRIAPAKPPHLARMPGTLRSGDHRPGGPPRALRPGDDQPVCPLSWQVSTGGWAAAPLPISQLSKRRPP
jgi:hypothetical protein